MSKNVEYKDKIIELYRNGYSYRDIADIMNKELNTNCFYYEGIRGTCRAYRRKLINDKAEKFVQEGIANANKTIEFGVVPTTKQHNKKKKILVLNDLHIPYQIDEIYDIVKKHKDEIGMIVFGGDILDMKCVSHFPDLEKPTIESELVSGIEVLSKIKQIVGDNVKMVLIYGNHEMRIQRYIASLPNKELTPLLNPRILEMLRDGFTIYNGGKESKHYDGIKDLIVINSWYVVIDHKLIVSHPNNFSKPVCKNSDKAVEYFIDIGEEFEALVAAHNHHYGYNPDHFQKLSIESGCLCKPMEYGDRKTNYKAQGIGYVLVTFDKDGHIDANETRLFTLPRQQLEQNNDIEF